MFLTLKACNHRRLFKLILKYTYIFTAESIVSIKIYQDKTLWEKWNENADSRRNNSTIVRPS